MTGALGRIGAAARLGWKIESNWADPLTFVVYALLRPIGTALILTAMYWAVARHGAKPEAFAAFYLANAFHEYVVRVLIGMGWIVVEEREEYETLRYVYVSPVGLLNYLTGRATVKFGLATVSVVLLLLLGATVLHVPWDPSQFDPAGFAVAFVLGIIATLFLGYIVAGYAMLLPRAAINLNEGAAPEDMLSIRAWVEPHRMVTLRHRRSRSIKAIAAELDRGSGPAGVAELTSSLVERVLEYAATRVDTLSDAIAACEDQVLTETRGELRTQLADHRRRAIALRRFLAPQREALGKLAQIQVSWLDATARRRIVESADRMTRTVEELDAARDRAAVTQEELQSKIAEATNNRLYVLSIMTSVFLPLGFVCSLLGVNVGGVPLQHDDWAFWALCGMFVVLVTLQIWFFRRRGWFGR